MAERLKDLIRPRNYFAKEEKVDRKTIGVLSISAFSLTMIYYFSSYTNLPLTVSFFRFFGLGAWGTQLNYWLTVHPDASLHHMIYWACVITLFYFVVPALAVRLWLRESLNDYGLKLKGMLSTWKLYVLLFIIILPCVVLVSYNKHFQQTYPFYFPAVGTPLFPRLLYWQVFYALQFFSLEFFFRGFMVHGTRHRFGIYSVFIMVVPYCMIHFGKPLPEAVGSIIAGVVLGLLSYRTRSVWMGFLLHVVVALSMDYLSLWHRGFF